MAVLRALVAMGWQHFTEALQEPAVAPSAQLQVPIDHELGRVLHDDPGEIVQPT